MSPAGKQTIAVFGSYSDSEMYSRNQQLIAALRATAGSLRVIRPQQRQENATSNHQRLNSLGGVLAALGTQFRNFWQLWRQRQQLRNVDVIFVPYPAYLDCLILRLIRMGMPAKPVLVDAFLCLHDTVVNDRAMVPPGSILARAVAALESATLASAQKVFIDTEQQRQLLTQAYKIPPQKLVVTPVGIDEVLWKPLPKLPLVGDFELLFWGTFIPLHGIETIVEAANIVARHNRAIRFRLMGDGQTADTIESLLAEEAPGNLIWQRGLFPAAQLQQQLSEAHAVLGIFGQSEKAGNVIPYKAHQALASAKPIITRSGAAMDQLLEGDTVRGISLVPPGDAQALANAVLALYADYAVVEPEPLRHIYQQKLSNQLLQQRVRETLASLQESTDSP